jgi:S-adenosylmethionine synthetase
VGGRDQYHTLPELGIVGKGQHLQGIERCLVQVAYGIGLAHPLSVYVNSYGTGRYSDEDLTKIINQNFDLRPGMIIKDLELRKPFYRKTSAYGHFGRPEPEFKWEHSKKLDPSSFQNVQPIREKL